jgi:hypothetical protein
MALLRSRPCCNVAIGPQRTRSLMMTIMNAKRNDARIGLFKISTSATLRNSTATAATATHNTNVAKYLLNTEDDRGQFLFCGSMRFGLTLTDALRECLREIACDEDDERQPHVFAKEYRRMLMLPAYARDSFADDRTIFYGREVRRVSTMEPNSMIIQLCLSSAEDSEGWTEGEREEYSGWLSDSQRRWRNEEILSSEGCEKFRETFGNEAYTLHHRFYLHTDDEDQFWLSAEDGCEGVAIDNKEGLTRDQKTRDFGEGSRNALKWW